MVRTLRAFLKPIGLGMLLLAVFLAPGAGVYSASAQQDETQPARRFDMPKGPIVRKVPPIDHIERPGRAASPETESDQEDSEWEAIWERNATPDPEEVERIKRRRQEMETNGTLDRSGGYYRQQFPGNDSDVIRRRTHVPYLKDGELQRIPQDTYEPYP